MRISDWTLREIVQGKPWAHPTHAMFIHFPTALYPTALAFGVLSHVQRSAHAADAATLLIGLGIAATVPAALTGLLDWSGMVAGSTKRGVATKHMLYQGAAFILAAIAFALFLVDGRGPASFLGLLVLGGAIVVMVAGNWLGGVLVYRMAMRVGGSTKPPTRRRSAPIGEPQQEVIR
jgi:uncharacterized membrane protein